MVRQVGPGGDQELPKVGKTNPLKAGNSADSKISRTSDDIVPQVIDKLFSKLSPRAKEILADRTRGLSSDKNPIADA